MTAVAQYTLALVLLVGFAWLPGYALERRVLRERDLGGLRPLSRLVLGLVFWIAIAFALAATGWLNAVALGVVATAVVGIALWVRLSGGSGLRATRVERRYPLSVESWGSIALVSEVSRRDLFAGWCRIRPMG